MAKKIIKNGSTYTPAGQPVCEDGVHYNKGDIMELSEERAEALGRLVVPISPPPAGEE